MYKIKGKIKKKKLKSRFETIPFKQLKVGDVSLEKDLINWLMENRNSLVFCSQRIGSADESLKQLEK